MSRDTRGRFEKGFCGNPNGRPRKVKRTLDDIHHEDEFIEATEELISVNVGGKVQRRPAIDFIRKQLVRKAVAGDTRCMLKVMELRENYAVSHKENLTEVFGKYLETKKSIRRNPEDVTDETVELISTLEATFRRNGFI